MRLRELLLLFCLVPFVWNGADNKEDAKPKPGVKEDHYKLDLPRLIETVRPRFAKLPPNAKPMAEKMMKALKKMRMHLTVNMLFTMPVHLKQM